MIEERRRENLANVLAKLIRLRIQAGDKRVKSAHGRVNVRLMPFNQRRGVCTDSPRVPPERG